MRGYNPYTTSSDARAWSAALRSAEVAHYGQLSWWQRRLYWLVQRVRPVRTVLQAGFEADVLLRFADIQDDRLEDEGTPTPREQRWSE